MRRLTLTRRWLWAFFGSALALIAVWLAGGGELPALQAQPAPDWPQVVLQEVTTGLNRPVQLTHAGDGSGRIFVLEQTGRILLFANGPVSPTTFLDISDRVLCCGEQGLLSVAFPPGFSGKGYFYVNYTAKPDGRTVVARYRLTADPNLADQASETVVLTVDQPFSNHNGGQLAFGPNDGNLYIAMGDGGSGNDPGDRAQNLGDLLGKLLRIDVETGSPTTYTIPAGNPFTQTVEYRPEIWALGLRNPWRVSFDRLTGDLYIGDVGQNKIEEIDYQPAGSPGGRNYGWRTYEGSQCTNIDPCDPAGMTFPVAEYSHGFGCSVTGGFVSRGADDPQLNGIYFYGDACSGRLWGLRRDGTGWSSRELLYTPLLFTSFGEDEAGRLYAVHYGTGSPDGTGRIYRLTAANPTPTATSSPTLTPSPTIQPRQLQAFVPASPHGSIAGW